jgi:hypothetical protein
MNVAAILARNPALAGQPNAARRVALMLISRGGSAGGDPPAAPVFTAPPVFSGTVRIGNVGTVTPGTVTGSPAPTRTYQLTRDGVPVGSPQIGTTFTFVAADIGPALDVIEVATNDSGSASQSSANALRYDLAAARFSAGQVGIWIDPQNAGSLFTNTGGTTQANVGDSVARANDLSGNAIVFTQSTMGARPLLQEDAGARRYLYCDAGDSLSSSGSIIWNATQYATIVAGVRNDSNTAAGIIFESASSSDTVNGSFAIGANSLLIAGRQSYFANLRGTTSSRTIAIGTYVAPNTGVITGLYDIDATDIANPVSISHIPTAATTTDTSGSTATSTWSNNIAFIGRRAGSSLGFDGRLYQLFVTNELLSGDNLTEVQQWCRYRTGV